MPVLDPTQGAIAIALFTIFWGIVIESWFVSRWTIIFNVVPFIVMLATIETGEWTGFLGLYLLLSLGASLVTGHQGIKQLFGAKGYGALSLALALAGSANTAGVYVVWIGVSIATYFAWWRIRIWKDDSSW